MTQFVFRLFPSFSLQYPVILLSSCLAGLSAPTLAIDYGVYDARALAMGGAAVAIGNSNQAAYYNPALLAFASSNEERDKQTYMPSLAVQMSTAIEAAADAADDHLDREISQAISAFNSQKSPANARRVADTSRDLHRVLDKIANKDLVADGFLGIAISEPGDQEGGAFYMGARAVGVATTSISQADIALLNEYTEAMDQMANGVSPLVVAIQHPNLIGANNQFRDPTSTLTSSAHISGLVIGEWGLALAKELSLWDQPLMVGLTPKLMRIDAYSDTIRFNNTDIDSVDEGVTEFADSKSSLLTLNADLGMATMIGEHYRVGLAIKDSIGKSFATRQSSGPALEVKLRPRSRLGLGYINQQLSLGLDYDVQKTTPIAQ
ncbi:MAG TPA: conjugal transfer protein TraF [Cellvibrio sp.]|nr:conjugal transfer protein TraF [Cellvibrio sp.]